MPRRPIDPIPDFHFRAKDDIFPGETPDTLIPWTSKYKYLGQKVENAPNSKAAASDRINLARSVFLGPLRILWSATSMPRELKCYLYDVLVMSKLKYGLGAVVLDKDDMKKLREFHHESLMTVTGIPYIVTVWGDKVPVSYTDTLTWANARSIDAILRTERLQLAGLIYATIYANRAHPVRLGWDEWDEEINRDLQELPPRHGRARTREDLADKYRSRMLKVSQRNLFGLRIRYRRN